VEPRRRARRTPTGLSNSLSSKELEGTGGVPAARRLSRSAAPSVRPGARPLPAPPLPTDDQELIRAVLAGDGERFHDLVRRHAAPLWVTIRRSLRDRDEARDVLQETWLRALEGLAGLRDPARLRAWLLSIALNLVRERSRRPAHTGLEALEDGGPAAEGGPDDCDARDTARALRAEIERLPPRQREVFDLRMNHELSHAEIAALLGITEEGSRANHYQALRRLRAHFPEGAP
jgi:RNA polymerase sigma factor (sigma-70 family)